MSESLIIIGFKAAGKTTLAKILGQLLDLPIYDLDLILLNKLGFDDIKSCFNVLGEMQFRHAELQIVEELALISNTKIISTGGGVVLNHNIMYMLKKMGKILCLNTNYQHIENRLFKNQEDILYLNQRLTRAGLQSIYEERLPLYLAHADIIIGDI